MDQQTPFAARVLEVVARIPEGKVTTYGTIARAIVQPRSARMVGWVLNSVPESGRFPCHRVVDRNGFLSGGWHFGHPDVMRRLLEGESVPFLDTYQVDLSRCLWIPWEDEPS